MTITGPIPLEPARSVAKTRPTQGKALDARQIGLLARQYRDADDMEGYRTFFAEADPGLRQHFMENGTDAAFLRDTGRVAGAVNIFRKLRYKSYAGPMPAFEKIYRRNAPDLNRLKWVYRNLWGKPPYRMPRLIEVIDGRHLSVALFGFEPFEPVSPDDLITVMVAMNEFSIGQPVTAFDHVHPSLLRMPALYMSRRKTLARHLEVAGIAETELARVEASAMAALPVFNHGDLHRFNVGRNGAICDWDCSCFAPAAHDLGRALAALRTFRFVSGLRDFITNRLGQDVAKDRQEKARIMFFYMVYAAKTRTVEKDSEQIATLRKIFSEIQAAFNEN
ncbi:MAG: aminoglycoside phosphotransferase family protein [Roseinatronobacter sp.]